MMLYVEWLRLQTESLLSDELSYGFSDRKLYLFGCACLRRVWPLLPGEDARAAVEAAERHADGLLSRRALVESWALAEERSRERLWVLWVPDRCDCPSCQAGWTPEAEDAQIAQSAQELASRPGAWAARAAFHARKLAAWGAPLERRQIAVVEEGRAQYALLGDLFETDPRRFRVDPAWLRWEGGAAARLARAVSQGQSEAAPALADALEEAGCDQSGLVRHLRGPGPHVPGCWAVDALLGRR
jgi:hypothetical protein